MNYRNTEMKLDQIVNYFNEEKINLSPAFQRGHVWRVGTRRKLIANIVQGRPIPAIFLYKEEAGSRYSYNILDGKQRLESLILFIGASRDELAIKNWHKYFFSAPLRKNVNFWINLPAGKKSFKTLDEETLRDFREYAIPTIEIKLTEESHLDEIINLFVDINQQGVAVSRFDIVKAMSKNNDLLHSVFNLLAIEEKRSQDIFYKAKKGDFTQVLKKMQIVANVSDAKSQVDRMWERLLEIVLFVRTGNHRKPVDTLKSFIRARDEQVPKLNGIETKKIRRVFKFINQAYKTSTLGATSLATDQTHFYTMITALISSDLFTRFEEKQLVAKLVAFGKIVDGKAKRPKSANVLKALNRYLELSSDRTTDTPRREERQAKFIDILTAQP